MSKNRILLYSFTTVVICLSFETGFAQSGRLGLAARLRELDKDNNGKLSLQEFNRDEATFKTIDSDDDGQIDVSEIKAFLQAGGKLGRQSAPVAEPTEYLGEFSDGMPVSLESCRSAAAYSQSANGHAVLVIVDGKKVYEKYDNGWSRERPHRLASGTKSFAGVAAALAVEDGLFKFDDRVADTITEWRDDPRLSKVTVRQLLSLTSGIDPGENSTVLPYSKAILAEAKHQPSVKFEYGPNPFQIFGELMIRKLAAKEQTFLDYLRQRVFEPIGMKTGQWRLTRQGHPHVPSGAFVTARDWAKFGELLMRGGQWDGKQILREELLAELVKGSKANPSYGITFWLNRNDGVSAGTDSAARTTTPSVGIAGVKDLFMAAGAGKQRLYVIQSLKLVAVRFGETKGRRFQDDAFLNRLVTQSKPQQRAATGKQQGG